MDMAVNPENYKGCEDLSTEDFVDVAFSNAQELGIEKEFDEFLKLDDKYKE